MTAIITEEIRTVHILPAGGAVRYVSLDGSVNITQSFEFTVLFRFDNGTELLMMLPETRDRERITDKAAATREVIKAAPCWLRWFARRALS